MKNLLQISREKLESMGGTINPHYSIIPQLMLAVFNSEEQDNLEMAMETREDMEQEVLFMMEMKDQVVLNLLAPNQEDQEFLIQEISQAKTPDELRDVLIVELLQTKMMENSDWVPLPMKK